MLLKAFGQLLAARTIAQLYNEARREEIGEFIENSLYESHNIRLTHLHPW
jgi:hypothetical protein